jgi:hypothetical protein
MNNVFKITILSLVLLTSCIFERFEKDNTDGDCVFDPVVGCIDTPFSIVDADTYQNLVGYDGQLINPDTVKIVNTRGQDMFFDIRTHSNGWISFETFGPFQEIHCFNQCLLDSAFALTYYMYLGNGDTDTIEARFALNEPDPVLYYNGKDATRPNDAILVVGGVFTPFWFQKSIN